MNVKILESDMRILSELIDKAKINLAREVEKRDSGPGTQEEGFYRGLVTGYEYGWRVLLKLKLEEEAHH